VAESWGKPSFQENERVTDSRARAQRRGTASKSSIVFLNAETKALKFLFFKHDYCAWPFLVYRL